MVDDDWLPVKLPTDIDVVLPPSSQVDEPSYLLHVTPFSVQSVFSIMWNEISASP